jgi:hypothetical protein
VPRSRALSTPFITIRDAVHTVPMRNAPPIAVVRPATLPTPWVAAGVAAYQLMAAAQASTIAAKTSG